MRKLEYIIPDEYSGKKLINYLKSSLGFSTSIVQSLRHTEGSVMLNGENARVIDIVKSGDMLEIVLPEKSNPPLLWEKELDIIYEDDDLLIVNKPAGIPCHPSHSYPNFTMANAVAAYLSKNGKSPGASRTVGRLDKGTSGLLLFAKNSFSASKLNGKIDKIYIALASKIIDKSGYIDTPIFRPDPNKTLRETGTDGDSAYTEYEPISVFGNYTLLKVKIKTGRTHQIRVHFKSIGAPLAGDDMYGGPVTDYLHRPALHCSEITFMHPTTNMKMHFSIPLPDDINQQISDFSLGT